MHGGGLSIVNLHLLLTDRLADRQKVKIGTTIESALPVVHIQLEGQGCRSQKKAPQAS